MSTTPYMGLVLPVVTETVGPDWAEELNTALEGVDDHDHTSGKGRLITSAALNINDDVSVNNHNLTNARSYNMEDQNSAIAGASDIRSLYAVLGELYYNDGLGNQVQLTSGGAINAASIGGIGGDYATSTANVYYNSTSKTFFFDQNTNRRAKLDIGDLIIRETVASANGVTVKSPSSLASSYTVTLPTALPASNKMLQMSTTGVLSPEFVATSHIDPAGLGSAAYAAGSVGTSALADDSVTAAKVDPAGGFIKLSKQIFSSAGTYPLIIPTGVDRGFVRALGGGGGGGSGNSGNTSGGGGGAGAEVRNEAVTLIPSVATTFAPSDVDASAETITINNHGYVANQTLSFSSTGGLPGGISANTVYYVKSPSTNAFQISATSGPGLAVNITSQGTGVHTVTTVYAVTIGAAGLGAPVVETNGTNGGETFITRGTGKLCRFPGGKGGIGATSFVPGVGGADFTWENRSTPGGNESMPGSNPINAEGLGGAATGSGGGGGGSMGNGGAGGVGIGNPGSAATGFGAGGGGGAAGGASADGFHGYAEVLYWENINP